MTYIPSPIKAGDFSSSNFEFLKLIKKESATGITKSTGAAR